MSEKLTLSEPDALSFQDAVESSARSYPRSFPMAPVAASGAWIESATGEKYLDCLAGAGTLALGHNHASINQAVEGALHSGTLLHGLDFMTPEKRRFIELYRGVLPGSLKNRAKLHFCSPAGTDAVEAALKLAQQATGRKGIFAFTGAYHGMTLGASGVSASPGMRLGPAYEYQPVTRFPFPNQAAEGQSFDAVALMRSYLEDSHSGVGVPAAIILEPIQGEGGVNVVSDDSLRAIRELASEFGILLIFDEVQCGVGRSGKIWACEYASVEPDILVASKAIGGGLPLAVIAYKQELDAWAPGAHTGTFRGNTLAMVAGREVLVELKAGELLGNVQRQSKAILEGLNNIRDCAGVVDVRGRGLMIGIETAGKELAQKIQQECFNRKLIVERGGRNDTVIRLLPPLNIGDSEVQIVVDKLVKIIGESLND